MPRMKALIEYLRTSPPAKASGQGTGDSVPAMADDGADAGGQGGAAVYQDHCAICHGDHMEGIAPAFPMLIGVGKPVEQGRRSWT
jgi:mono/diheme cytochrome c family protein